MVKRIVKAGEVEIEGQVLKIQGNAKLGSYVEILECLKSQLDAMLSHHSKVLVVRLDLRMYFYSDSNELVSKFMRKVRKKLKARYSLSRFGYVWVREQNKSENPHYHLALFIDGNLVAYPKNLLTICTDVWAGWEQSPSIPKNCYTLVTRGNSHAYAKAYKRISYLAKTYTKGSRSKAANDYSSSRIKPRISASP